MPWRDWHNEIERQFNPRAWATRVQAQYAPRVNQAMLRERRAVRGD